MLCVGVLTRTPAGERVRSICPGPERLNLVRKSSIASELSVAVSAVSSCTDAHRHQDKHVPLDPCPGASGGCAQA